MTSVWFSDGTSVSPAERRPSWRRFPRLMSALTTVWCWRAGSERTRPTADGSARPCGADGWRRAVQPGGVGGHRLVRAGGEPLAVALRRVRAGRAGRPRPGRPPVYGHDERLRVVATVTEQPPDPDSHWTHQAVADRLADTGMSADTVGVILNGLDLKPHRVRGRLTRRDIPGFWERAYVRHGTACLAQPGRTVLLDPDPTAAAPRRVRLPRRPRRPDQGVHRPLRRHRQAVQVDLRRQAPQGGLAQ